MKIVLPQSWFSLRYHPKQTQLWRSRARFIGVAAGRGSGKTETSRRKIVRCLPDKKKWETPLYAYCLPTYKQAKRVAWRPIKKLIPASWVAKNGINETEMSITTVFGSVLYVVGMDKPQRIEGDQWDGIVIDESCDQRPNSFGLSVLPALSHRNGWCWRIGVPKRVGIGASEFREFCLNKAEEYYTWPSEDILTPDQLKYARENLDEKDYAEQYLASWETASGAVFFAWSKANVDDSVLYNSNMPLIVGCDFNVDPMAWVIGQHYKTLNEFHVLDEVWVRNTNTQQCLDRLWKRYGDHQAGFDFYGDAAAQARHTSASESDYIQIKNDKRFKNARVLYPRKNPRVANRFSACNAAFCNASQQRRVSVHPKCVNLIRDLESRAYLPGTTDPNDYGDIGHITDALGYVLYQVFPLYLTDVIQGSVHISAGAA